MTLDSYPREMPHGDGRISPKSSRSRSMENRKVLCIQMASSTRPNARYPSHSQVAKGRTCKRWKQWMHQMHALWIHSDSLTWKWAMATGKILFLYEQVAFHFHVRLCHYVSESEGIMMGVPFFRGASISSDPSRALLNGTRRLEQPGLTSAQTSCGGTLNLQILSRKAPEVDLLWGLFGVPAEDQTEVHQWSKYLLQDGNRIYWPAFSPRFFCLFSYAKVFQRCFAPSGEQKWHFEHLSPKRHGLDVTWVSEAKAHAKV